VEQSTLEVIRAKVPKQTLVAAAMVAATEPTRHTCNAIAVFEDRVEATDGRRLVRFPLAEPIKLNGSGPGPILLNAKAIMQSRSPKAITKLEIQEGHFPRVDDVVPKREEMYSVAFNVKLLTELLRSLAKAGAKVVTFQVPVVCDTQHRPWRFDGYQSGDHRFDPTYFVGTAVLMPVSISEDGRYPV
jgi:hypothetical protein